MFVIASGLGMVVPILPVFVRDLGASGVWLGLAFSGFAITQTPLTPIVGRLGDRLGRRPFILIGLSAYVFIGVGLSMADSYQVVTLLRMGMGVGAACMFPSALAMVGELAPRGHEGRYMGMFMVSFTAGFGAGPLVGGVLKDNFGVDATFLTLAGAAVVAAAVVAFLMPSAGRTSQSEERIVPSFRVMVGDLRVWSLFVFNFTFGLGMGSVFTFIAIFMTESLLASATLVGLVVGSRAIISSIFQPLFGRLADVVPRHLLVIGGGLLMAAGTEALPLAQSVTVLLVLFLILGLAESAALPSSLAITTDLGRIYGYGTLIGFSNAVLILGVLTGSVGGSLIESGGSIEDVFRTAGILIAVGVMAFMVTWSQGRRRAMRVFQT